jgi:UDP-N-acetylglucosamine 2-epimerase (non-hydrolysing)
MLNITLVAGARPNFVKIAPIIHAIQKNIQSGKMISFRLVHTGQHYDEKMSQSFFFELNIPQPDINLECGGGSQAEQAAAIMIAFEKDLINYPASLVLVVGDVTSTMACSIVAKKLNTKVVHVEAGIRSGDLSMPEEINRMVTDSITDYYFTTTIIASQNLVKIGADESKIFFVGNVMIDTLLSNKTRFKKPSFWDEIVLENNNYIVLTLHRPSNVDEGEKLKLMIDCIIENVRGLPIVFPIHPRTAKIFRDLGISAPNLHIVDPLSYLEFNFIVQNAKGVITDSGGITEETTVLNIPCITLRETTERPETVDIGTNILVGTNNILIKKNLEILLNNNWKVGGIPELWDGKAAARIIEIILLLNGKKEDFNC